jgi:hypothetical protein
VSRSVKFERARDTRHFIGGTWLLGQIVSECIGTKKRYMCVWGMAALALTSPTPTTVARAAKGVARLSRRDNLTM